MKLTLKETNAKLLNVNPRPELHGDEKKPAADLSLNVHLHNKELDQFDLRLRHALYEKDATQGDLVSGDDPEHLPKLRFPQLDQPLKWDGEQVGGKVTFHRGISAKSDLVIEGVLINKFQIEAIEGGSVGLTFRVQFKPEEKEIGKLCMLTGQDVQISVEPPVEDALAEQREPAEAGAE